MKKVKDNIKECFHFGQTPAFPFAVSGDPGELFINIETMVTAATTATGKVCWSIVSAVDMGVLRYVPDLLLSVAVGGAVGMSGRLDRCLFNSSSILRT